jgi:hypothetical protein
VYIMKWMRLMICSPVRVDKFKKNEVDGSCSVMRERRSVHKVFLVGKPQESSPHGRPKHRWEDNIKMDLQDVKCESSWFRIVTGGGHF